MLLNYGEIEEEKKVSPEISLESFEVEEIERDDNGNINRILCGNDKIITVNDGLEDIVGFNLENVKIGDVIRLKSGGVDDNGFSIIYEATFAGMDSILSGRSELLDRIQRFTIGNLSFNEDFFREDINFFFKRIDKISLLIGLLSTWKHIDELDKDDIENLKKKFIEIGKEIEGLFESVGSSMKKIIDSYKGSEVKGYDSIFIPSTLNRYYGKGRIIKEIGEGKIDLKSIQGFEIE